MQVTTAIHQGRYCWMFSPGEGADKRVQRQELVQLKRLCRTRLGRSHGSLGISMWASGHHSFGRGFKAHNVIFISDQTVAFEATLMFC